MRYFIACWALLLLGITLVFGQVPMTGAGLPAPTVAAGGGACSQYTTLAAALDGGENTSAVQTLVCGMVTDGTYSLLDGLYVFATNSQANAQVNWAKPGTNNLTAHGSLTFSANSGYTSDGSTGYLDTGFIPSSAGGNVTLNSANFGACDFTGSVFGASGAQDGAVYFAVEYANTTTVYLDLNDGNFATIGSTNETGSRVDVRTSSSSITSYKNGSSIGSAANNSGTLETKSLYLLGFNNNGTAASFSSDQFGYFFFGGTLSGTQVTNIYNRLHTYLGAVSAPAGC